MWLKNNKAKIKVLLMKNIVIAYKINKKIKDHIAATANRITKSLQWHELSEGWIKKIYEIN